MAKASQPEANAPVELSDTQKAQLDKIRKTVEKFQERVFERFKDYVLGVSLLPPREEEKDRIPVLLLIDDVNSTKTPKAELREKLLKVFDEIAAAVDKKLLPEPLLLTELWQYCYDAKYEVLADIAASAPTYDVGMLSAIKLVEIHKQMVLKKFEKYIVCYVLGGSLVQGTATTKSDVDVFIVIDDTDVKKMTRAELRDKLRAIIIDLGFQAGDMTGVQNKINIQTYLLTDFWDYVKEANPIIFTFLRDGVPFFDRGIFMPWKQLLEMGRVKPSQEAIDVFMSSGEQYLKRVKVKLREMGIEDFFWATSTPAQAAIMLYGYPPPTPKELAGVLKDVFVKKEKMIGNDVVKLWEDVFKVRKDMEHGDKVDITGAEIDELYDKTEKFLNEMNTLFEKIQTIKDEERVLHTYESAVTLVRDVLRAEGHDVKEADLFKTFQKELVKGGRLPEKFGRILTDIQKAKADYDKGKLTKADVHDITRKGDEFFKQVLEYLQRKRAAELERAKIRVKHGESLGEVVLLGKTAFIIYDVGEPTRRYGKAAIDKDGSLGVVEDTTVEEFDDAIATSKPHDGVRVKDHIFESLKRIFGKDVEILLP